MDDSRPRPASYSLRAGLATAASDGGANLMCQPRYKSTQVALVHLRPADFWRNNVTKGVFESGKGGADTGGTRR